MFIKLENPIKLFTVYSWILVLTLAWIFVADSHLGLRGLVSGDLSVVFGPYPKKYTEVNMKLSTYTCFRFKIPCS